MKQRKRERRGLKKRSNWERGDAVQIQNWSPLTKGISFAWGSERAGGTHSSSIPPSLSLSSSIPPSLSLLSLSLSLSLLLSPPRSLSPPSLSLSLSLSIYPSLWEHETP